MKIRCSIVFFFFTMLMLAQIEHPKASPATTLTQAVGLSTISISYSRPAVRGRKIFGDLVPYNRIWRVGANESTKITIDTAFKVSDSKLAAGTYALYAFPGEAEWTVIFHNNTTHWGDGRKEYDENEDALRIKIKPEKVEHFQENFLISFDKLTHTGGNMIWHWENTSITIPIGFNTMEIMEEQIAKKLQAEKISAQTYYEIARYYQEQNIKLNEALNYLNKAISLDGDTYYFHRVKSLVEAALGDFTMAVASAKKSLQLAKKQDKDEFVRMNQKNIYQWSRKLISED